MASKLGGHFYACSIQAIDISAQYGFCSLLPNKIKNMARSQDEM